MDNAKRVIVTDVRYRMALPVIRSLGKMGLNVTCTDPAETPEALSLGFYSKYTSARAHLPAPSMEQDFIGALRKLSGTDKPVIIPVGMESLTVLCRNRDEVNVFAHTALPHIDNLIIANDKDRLMLHAKPLGIPCPETTTLRPDESIQALAERITYPAVVKYRQGELLSLGPQDRYQIVQDKTQLMKTFPLMHEKQDYPLVQEYVPGGGFGVSVVFDQNHEPITVFCHQRLREYPVSGGPSCYCRSDWNDALVQYALTLLKSLRWTGVAMVEFKGNPAEGYKLMEINPRFWGSSALAPISGCDITKALYQAALGQQAAPQAKLTPQYRLNRKMRFWLQDALSLFGYMKQSQKPFRYFWRHLGSLLNPAVRDGVFTIDDPRPAFRYFRNALHKRDKIIR